MPDATTYTTIGAILAIAASICNAIGYTVQKKGHNRLKEYNKDKEENEKKRLIKEKIWATGFAIYLLGGLLNAVSLFYAPQSLVLPLSAITLVANTLLATKVLGEPFFKADIFGMLSVLIGSVLAVMFGPRTAGGETTMNELKLRWGDYDFFLFFVILSACIVADYLLVRFYERKNAADETVTDELKHGSQCLLISYCILAGYFGALAFLFLKSFTEFIGSSISSQQNADQNAVNWYSYFTLICVVLTNFTLEFFRQRGLSYFHAVYVVPINQVVLIVMGTVMGGLYFQEFKSMNLVDGIMFVIAILMTVIGVFILAFNSGNVSEKTEAKINHTLTLSLDVVNNHTLNLDSDPPTLHASPSLPITRNMNDEVPDLPPPGMAGPIARIHGLHRSMASMHFSKDGKPFYLDKNLNKLSVLNVIGISSTIHFDFDGLGGHHHHHHGRERNIYKQQSKPTHDPHEHANGKNTTRHIKHSQSLPTYSNSSLDAISPPNGINNLELAMTQIKENNFKVKQADGKRKGVRFKDDGLPSEIEIVTKPSMSLTDYMPPKKSNSNGDTHI